jgi:hypothetical protein
LNAGEFISITRASLWDIEDAPAIDKNAASWEAGEYLVGTDLNPGEYLLTQVGNVQGNVTIRMSPNAGIGSTGFQIHNFSGQRYVTLQTGMYVEFSRATLTVAPAGGGNGGDTQTDWLLGEGQHRVGAGLDVEPGEYLLIQTGTLTGSFTVTRTPNATVGSADFLYIRNFTNRAYVRLNAGEFISITRANLWDTEKVTAIDRNAASWEAGEYLVGTDLNPGEYLLTQVGNVQGNVTIRMSPNAGVSSTGFQIHNFNGQRYVTLQTGMYVEFSRATLTRV